MPELRVSGLPGDPLHLARQHGLSSRMTMDALGRSDCLRLLASRHWGRVAFSDRALPTIRPLAYTLVGDCLVLHTGSDGLERTLDGQIVAFEVDEVDPIAGTGWTIVAVGPAHVRTRPLDLARPGSRAPRHGDAGGHLTQVTVTPGAISGCRTD